MKAKIVERFEGLSSTPSEGVIERLRVARAALSEAVTIALPPDVQAWGMRDRIWIAAETLDAALARLSPLPLVEEGLVEKLHELRDFLSGEKGVGDDVEPVFFGDPHPRSKGMFWWRDWMRETLNSAIAALSPAKGTGG